MTNDIAMPSPNNTNYERLFVRPFRGAAYDSRRGLGYDAQPMPSSKADRVADWLTSNLTNDEQCALAQSMVKARAARGMSGAAQDEEAAPSFDPNATRAGVNGTFEQKKRLNAGGSAMDAKRRRQIAQDAHFISVLKNAFARPGSATYDARERRKIAADAATMKSLEARFPDIAKIGIAAPLTDLKARLHSMATDGRLVRSLEERYPDLKKIGFA